MNEREMLKQVYEYFGASFSHDEIQKFAGDIRDFAIEHQTRARAEIAAELTKGHNTDGCAAIEWGGSTCPICDLITKLTRDTSEGENENER